MTNFKYEVLEETHEGWNVIKLTEGAFAGCKFTLGRVILAETPNEDGTYGVEIDYDIVNDFVPADKVEFEKVVVDCLSQLMHEEAEAYNPVTMK